MIPRIHFLRNNLCTYNVLKIYFFYKYIFIYLLIFIFKFINQNTLSAKYMAYFAALIKNLLSAINSFNERWQKTIYSLNDFVAYPSINDIEIPV